MARKTVFLSSVFISFSRDLPQNVIPQHKSNRPSRAISILQLNQSMHHFPLQLTHYHHPHHILQPGVQSTRGDEITRNCGASISHYTAIVRPNGRFLFLGLCLVWIAPPVPRESSYLSLSHTVYSPPTTLHSFQSFSLASSTSPHLTIHSSIISPPLAARPTANHICSTLFSFYIHIFLNPSGPWYVGWQILYFLVLVFICHQRNKVPSLQLPLHVVFSPIVMLQFNLPTIGCRLTIILLVLEPQALCHQ
jgi:hypothetical protein